MNNSDIQRLQHIRRCCEDIAEFILKIRQNTPTSKRGEGGEMNAARFCVNK